MWAWNYGHRFLDVILRANAIRSKSVYLVSTVVNILLTKYICKTREIPISGKKAKS